MTLRDLVANAGGNLWRMKLRTTLTIAGVIIAFATFVPMLSLGVGMQRNANEQFTKLGLFSTLQVYPLRQNEADTSKVKGTLNREAVQKFAAIPGVILAYPYDDFQVTAEFGGDTVSTSAQALPQAAVQSKLYSQMRAGKAFTADSAAEAMVTDDFLTLVHINDPDSVIGRQVILTARVISLDSGFVYALGGVIPQFVNRVHDVWRDSAWSEDFWIQVLSDMASGAMGRYLEGLQTGRRVVTDTLVIGGVLDVRSRGPSRTAPIIIPALTAGHLHVGDLSDDPADLLASLRSGSLFAPSREGSAREFPRVTVSIDPNASYEPIRDSIRAMGYRTFSYADEFKEIRRFYFYFNLILTTAGLIALATASLAIVNTMVTSIMERTREIGVLKSLGADDGDIRLIFLAESGLIGLIGAIVGVVVGWGITRVAARVAGYLMAKENIPYFEPFALPLWLILGSLAFGLIISLAAGLYPSSRAARVDPVEALRHD